MEFPQEEIEKMNQIHEDGINKSKFRKKCFFSWNNLPRRVDSLGNINLSPNEILSVSIVSM